jgi:hypothetical protein
MPMHALGSRHLHSTTATKCGFLPLRAEANEEEDSRKEKKEEEETGAPVVRGRGEESWSLVVYIYLSSSQGSRRPWWQCRGTDGT